MAHGDVGDLLGDVGDGDAVGERHALLERERRLERLERAPRELGIQAHLAAGEAGRIEDAHQQAGVGQRRRRAAAPVARGAGVRARALGPDADVARRRDRHDAAAAGADARHLGRQRVDDQVVLDLEGVVDERRAVDDERDVGRGAADVGAQQVAGPQRGAEARARDRARGRPGEDDAKRLLQRLAPGQQRRRAVGEVQIALEAQLAQIGVEPRRVAPEDELHEDVDDRRRRAGVLLGQRRGLRRDRDRDLVAQHLAGQLAQLLLVGGVDVGIEQADRHPLHLAATQHRELAARVVGVQRPQLAAVGQHPLDHAAAQVARDEWASGVAEGASPGGVGLPVERTADRAAVEDVAEALGGEERDLRQLARDDRVEPHGARVVEHRAALHPEAARALDDRRRGLARVTGNLGHLDAPVAYGDHVGERAADVDADHRIVSPSGVSDPRRRRALARHRGQALLALDDVPQPALAEHAVGRQRLRAARRAGAVDGHALDAEVRSPGAAGRCASRPIRSGR